MNIIKSIPAFRPLALVSLVCVLGTSPGWADAPRSVTVHYADLDLSSSAGATTLYHRIRGAAKGVCGTAGMSFVEKANWSACVNDAVGNAVSSVNSPLLTALYSGKQPTTVTAMLTK
jgi:UrcA family protein